MNKRDSYLNKRNTLDLIERDSLNGTKVGCVKYWKGTSYEHFRVMSDIVWKLSSQGYDCYTEVIFKNGCRADILAIDLNGNGTVIEVLHSETNKRFNLKLDNYPLPIVKVRTKGFNLEKWDL